MRNHCAHLAIVLLAIAPAFGSVGGGSVIISIQTDGSQFMPGGGCTGQDANVVAWADLEATFPVDIVITTEMTGMTMSKFGITLDGSCTLCYEAMTTFMQLQTEFIDNYNGVVGWNPRSDVATLVAAGDLPMAGSPDDEIHSTATSATSGLAAYLVFQKPDPCQQQCCCIYEHPTSNAYVTDTNDLPMDVTVIPLCITPEPAAGLLLLAGLPWLARRRR